MLQIHTTEFDCDRAVACGNVASAPGLTHQLQVWLDAKKDDSLEFHEARYNFQFDTLVKFCGALANRSGGSIVLGVTDSRPRIVVGTLAFDDLERTTQALVERLHLRVTSTEFAHFDGRVVAFNIPRRPIGVPIAVDGVYWTRVGGQVVVMPSEVLHGIFAETAPDFSAEICPVASFDDLDPAAIATLRDRWRYETGDVTLADFPSEQLLRNAELITSEGVTNAALILLGKRKALEAFLPQAKTIFEYRESETPGPANQRVEHREGFLLFFDELWKSLDDLNESQLISCDSLTREIPTFRDGTVREAILNAVCHRDYRKTDSILIRQCGHQLEIKSPGGFPGGVTPENVLDTQSPRNRLIAQTLIRCGLIDCFGDGAKRMLVESIADSKPLPDYSRSDAEQVVLRLSGDVRDLGFVKCVARLAENLDLRLSPRHHIVLDLVRSAEQVPAAYSQEVRDLRAAGVVVFQGRGVGARNLLSPKIYQSESQVGVVHRPTNRKEMKAMLLRHLADCRDKGSPLADLSRLLPFLTRGQVQTLLKELKAGGQVHSIGKTKGGRWYPGNGPAV